MKILIIDDDPRLRDLLRIALERADHTVVTGTDGQAALMLSAREQPDLIILDIGLPEIDGLEACRRIRARSQVPILFLTARDDEIDRILGLELGADDYVTKPFSPREVVARVKAILKRSAGHSAPTVQGRGLLQLDLVSRQCHVAGQEITLTATEFSILSRLLADPARLIPRHAMITALWGANSQVSDRTLDSHLRNLRRKLAAAGCPDAIASLHGQGLRLGLCQGLQEDSA